MKQSSLIDLLSKTYRIERSTVALYDRHLKEAGLLPSGRGRHAPSARPEDAALLTIALLATSKPARAVERVKRFHGLQFIPERSKGEFPTGLMIEEGQTFGGVLTKLFATNDYLETNLIPYVEVHENQRTARIEIHTSDNYPSEAFFRSIKRTDAQSTQDRKELFGIRQSRGLAGAELLEVYLPFYLERRDGLPSEDILGGDVA